MIIIYLIYAIYENFQIEATHNILHRAFAASYFSTPY